MASEIVKFQPDGTKTTFASSLSSQLLDLAVDGAGNVYVTTGSQILKYSADATLSVFASQVDGVWPLAFDRQGNLYAAVNPTGGSSILKFSRDGTRSTFVSLSGGSSATALAFDQSGNLFVSFGSTILKILPDGTQSMFASGDFKSLAFDSAGTLFAALNGFNSSEPAIVKFSSAGARTTFASGPLTPLDLAFEPVTEKLRNISARALVGTGDDVLIGGFILGGSALANNAVVVRAIGPSLAQAGVSNGLADPALELYDSSGALIVSNDDWQDTQEEEISATGLAPTDPNEAAIYATLPAGNYTAVVRGAGDTTGTALVEVYSTSQ